MDYTAARLLELLSLLQARPSWSAPELAERLGITTRTVRRDVTRLRELGYPVAAEAGRTGGYRLGAGAALPPLLLADDEAVAVAVGLRLAAASGGVAGYQDAAIAALAKLEQVLPARLRERVVSLDAATVLVRPPAGPFVDPDALLTLAHGCRHHERVRFGYRDYGGNVSDRRAEPYSLVHAQHRWYLVARDLDRRDWRTFRVDRMREPALTGHRFVPTAEPDAAQMVVDGLTLAPYRWQAEVLLRASPEEAAAEVPRTVGSLQAAAGGTLLRLGGDDLGWIARYVAGLPFEAQVRHPLELRTELRALAERLRRA